MEGDVSAAFVAFFAFSISIHTLRVEGDLVILAQTNEQKNISIHTLRVEGDSF